MDINVERGIVVDLNMKTSHEDIYACGDVAEVHDFVRGTNRVIPIWPGAHFGGRIAGLNMAGSDTEYTGCTGMNTLSYFGLNIASGGIVNPPDDSYEVLTSNGDVNYQKLVLKDNKVAGMVFIGNIDKGGVLLNMMKDGVDTGDFKGQLIAENASGLTCLRWKLRSWAGR
jgi:NAD(P)H-nitrite reductase large subunit